jgi:hypothetical protein
VKRDQDGSGTLFKRLDLDEEKPAPKSAASRAAAKVTRKGP